MSIFKILQDRRAVRNYEQREIERDKIEQLLAAAVLAPNDRMREPWAFYVIEKETKAKFEKVAKEYLDERFPTKPKLVDSSLKVVKTTPVIIVVTSDIVEDDEEASIDNEYAVCCAIHSMWLAAHELGLGFVWRTRGVGLVRDKRMYSFLSIPNNKKIVGTIFLGYPEKEALEQMKPKERTSFEKKTTWLS